MTNDIYRNLCVTLLLGFLVLGIVFAFILPPFQAPDEPAHWLTANNRSEDVVSADPRHCAIGHSLNSFLQMTELHFKYRIKTPRGLFENLTNVGESCDPLEISYGTLLTYPGVLVAKAIVADAKENGIKATYFYYLSRLLQGSCMALLLARLLYLNRYKPKPGVMSLIAILMAPIAMQQSFTVTSDLIVNSFAIVLFSMVIFYDRVTWFDSALFIVIGAIACLTKPILLPLILPVIAASALYSIFLRSDFRADGANQARSGFSLINLRILTLVASAAVFSVLCVYTAFNDKGTFAGPRGEVDGAKQLAFIIAHPAKALGTLVHAVVYYLSPKMFDSPLGWLDTPLSQSTSELHFTLIKIAMAVDLGCLYVVFGNRPQSTKGFASNLKFRLPLWSAVFLLLALAIFLSALLNAVAMYLAWTPVGLNAVHGLQYRYFLPQAILSVALISSIGLYFNSEPEDGSTVLSFGGKAERKWIGYVLCGALAVFVMNYIVCIVVDIAQRYW